MSEEQTPYRPGGRPRKDADAKRSRRLSCYVTPAEAAAIELKCKLGGKSVSDFLRALALRKEISPTVRPDEAKRLRADIGRALGNLNQIAKKVNQGKVRGLEATDLEEIYEFLAEKMEAL